MLSTTIEISELRFHAGTQEDQARGLLGYLTFTLNGSFRIDGVTLRETQKGDLCLSYPGRTDGKGRERASIAPIHDQARAEVERQVFAALPRLIVAEG